MAKQPINRKKTAAQLREDAEIARIKAAVTFTAPEIKRDEFKEEFKSREELDRETTIGSFDVRGNDEAMAEVLKAKEIIAAEKPKEEKPLRLLETDEEKRLRALAVVKNEAKNDSRLNFCLSSYKKTVSEKDFPKEITNTTHPCFKVVNNQVRVNDSLSHFAKTPEEAEKLAQLAETIGNKYRGASTLFNHNAKVCDNLASAEFTAVCQLMKANGITPDSPAFDEIYKKSKRMSGDIAGTCMFANPNYTPAVAAENIKQIAQKHQQKEKVKINVSSQTLSQTKANGRD